MSKLRDRLATNMIETEFWKATNLLMLNSETFWVVSRLLKLDIRNLNLTLLPGNHILRAKKSKALTQRLLVTIKLQSSKRALSNRIILFFIIIIIIIYILIILLFKTKFIQFLKYEKLIINIFLKYLLIFLIFKSFFYNYKL